MKTLEWINNEIVANNLICEEIDKIRQAKSKKQLFEVCCSAKGIDFLPMMRAKGHPLSYDIIQEEFGRYINGQYKPEINRKINGVGYTSAIYCQCEVDVVTLVTTTACFMDCDVEVYVAPYNYAQIVVDENCRLRICCPPTSRLIVEYFGNDSTIEILEGKDRVRLKKMSDGE